MRYEIKGDPFPVLIVYLESGESINCQQGAMSWMSPNVTMSTSVGGGFGKVFGRMFSGESIFYNTYTATGKPGMIAFSATFPGKILTFDISKQPIIAQKGSYFVSQPGVEFSVAFQKNVGVAFFGGEGFIMQRLSGKGLAWLEVDGFVMEYDLKSGEQMIVNTGHLAAMSATCTMDIKVVKGVGNALFGGEGFFNTVVTGPGKVYLQSMPIDQLAADLIIPNDN